jgi:hypothetical protein
MMCEVLRQSLLAIPCKPLDRLALALAGALALGASDAGAQDGPACEKDLSDLERVSAEIVHGASTTREVTLLLHDAKEACAAGRSDEAHTQLGEAWAQILEDSSLLPPTVPELARNPCSDGMGAVEQQVAATEAGALTQEAAGSLLDQARQLCRDGQELDAEAKLSMAWAMVTTARGTNATD